jgi:hypothetical protein
VNANDYLQDILNAVERVLDAPAQSLKLSLDELHDNLINGYEPCDECQNWIPSAEPSETNNYHKETCSLWQN